MNKVFLIIVLIFGIIGVLLEYFWVGNVFGKVSKNDDTKEQTMVINHVIKKGN